MQKETNQVRGTHSLGIAKGGGGICQDTERNQPTKGHSLSKDHRGRDLSGHGMKAKGHSLPGDHRWRDLSGHEKKEAEQGALTNWRPWKGNLSGHGKSNQARGSHKLETTEGGTCQDTE